MCRLVVCAQTFSGPANDLSSQLQLSRPHVNPMEQLPNQLTQKLPILRYPRQTEIEVLSGVNNIHQPMLPAKCYCFTVAKTKAAIRLERINNANAAVFASSTV